MRRKTQASFFLKKTKTFPTQRKYGNSKTILQNLRDTRQGKTTILIAHRISTIESMDKIIFIEEGKLVALGRHEELLETCEAYRKMVELQKLEEEGGN